MSDCWSWNNVCDANGTLLSSLSGSAGDLGISNLRDPRQGKIWRAGGMPAEVRIALPASSGVSLFGLFNVNFRELGIVTLRLGTAPGLGDLWEQIIDPGEIVLNRQAVFVIRDGNGVLAPVVTGHATVLLEGGIAAEIGRIWIGGADWQPSKTHTVDGTEWGFEDLSVRSRTPRTGAFLVDRGSRLRSFTANYGALNPADYAALFEMDDRGLAQQMLFVPTSTAYDTHRMAILGKLGEMPRSNWRTILTTERSISILEDG